MFSRQHHAVLAAALVLVASAVFAGTAKADLTGISVTTSPTGITVSGVEPNPACIPGPNYFFPGSAAGIFIDVYDLDPAGFGQYIFVPVSPGGAFSVAFPNGGATNYGAGGINPEVGYFVDVYNACSFSAVPFELWVVTPSAARPRQPAGRGGYCSAVGNKNPLTGVVYGPGTFLDLVLGEADSDPSFKGATPAGYYQGIGLSCDPPPAGYKDSGTKVDQSGRAATAQYGGMYEYWTKP